MGILLIAAIGALLVFVVARLLHLRLSLLGYLGAGVIAAFFAWLVQTAVLPSDPVTLVLGGTAIPLVSLAIGAVLTGLLLKVAPPLR